MCSKQKAKQDKTSEKYVNEREITGLPDRVQNNCHKHVTELGRRMNKKVNIQQRGRKYLKYRREVTELRNTITELNIAI